MSKVIRMNKKVRRRNHFLLYLVLLVVILFGILLGISKLLIVEQIQIQGNFLYSQEEIKDILQVHEGQNVVEVFMHFQKMGKDFPYIENVSYQFLSYKSIKISVHEKQIMGYILYMGKYFCLDKDGYVVDSIEIVEKRKEIPIIQGVKAEQMVVGDLVDLSVEILESCLTLHSLEKKYNLHIDIINFNGGLAGDIILTIGDQTVYIGDIKNINTKMVTAKEIIENLPPGESGIIYLNHDGSKSRYEKNIQ